MGLYAAKVVVSALVIVAVTEVSKRAGTFWGGLLASLPLISVLSFIWLYAETKDSAKVSELSWSILWLVIPSLTLFVALPLLLRRGVGFAPALALALFIMALAYFAAAFLGRRFGVTM